MNEEQSEHERDHEKFDSLERDEQESQTEREHCESQNNE